MPLEAQRREHTHDGCGHGARCHHQIVVLCDPAVRNPLILPRPDPLQGTGPHQPRERARVDAQIDDVSRPQNWTCPGALHQSLAGIPMPGDPAGRFRPGFTSHLGVWPWGAGGLASFPEESASRASASAARVIYLERNSASRDVRDVRHGLPQP